MKWLVLVWVIGFGLMVYGSFRWDQSCASKGGHSSVRVPQLCVSADGRVIDL